jgi:hypothetical protein
VILICLITGYYSTGANIVDRVIKINLFPAFGKKKELLRLNMLFLQMSQLPHQKACNDPWCHFIFGSVG